MADWQTQKRKTAHLKPRAQTQIAIGEEAAASYATGPRRRGRLMIKAGTKNVVLKSKSLSDAMHRSSTASARTAQQQTYPRSEYGAAKRYGKGPSQLKKALIRMRAQTASKIPVVGAVMGVSEYKAGGGPSASQLLKGKAKSRQKKYTSGPKGHMKTLDYAGIHPGSI